MADNSKLIHSAERNEINCLNFTVGFLVLTMGIYISAFALQVLFLR